MRTRKCIPNTAGLLSFLILLILFFAQLPVPRAAGAVSFEKVAFQSLDKETRLTAYLAKPAGAGPFPAVIFLHGCGGLVRNLGISPLYSTWAEYLRTMGFAVLMVDSASPRGEKATCGAGEKRRKMYRLRPFDAYAGLQYLQAQPFIRPEKIGLVGWSQGGGITLLTVVTKSIARPDPMTGPDFAVAAALYPALCNDRLQSEPFTKVAPHSWTTKIPLLVLQGEADNWTRAKPCIGFIEEAAARGNPVSILLYPEAYHAFDAPGGKLIKLPQYKTIEGVIPIVGTDKAARQKARADLPAFLRRYLMPGN